MAATVRSAANRGIARGLVTAVLDIAGHFELLRMLVVKELKVKYKASAIGLFWSLLNPLLLMLVYTAIFGTVFHSRPQYPVFILSGLLAWNFFGLTLPSATVSLVGNSNLIRKTRFPTALLPLSTVLAGFINFLISLVLLFGLLVVYRHPVGWSVVLLPVLLLAQLAFTAGLGLLLGAVNVFFRDVEHFLSIILTLWFFATPIIYPVEAVQGNPVARLVLAVNPMAWLVSAYQKIFYHSTWPDAVPTWGFILLSVALLLLGFTVFVRLSRRFVEEV
ncbi:MAG TPA: ABC transporter permease [Candidatus Dormibacteraeota bacterium]|nr:ABC transporter permease [Candidatus Dormibacteraeota bacterium]